MEDQFAAVIRTEDGTLTLFHPAYDETFHSQQGARFEADNLYMGASHFREGLAAASFGSRIVVLDVGLGLGYNAMMTIECWMQSDGLAALDLISLEQSPELVRALADENCSWKIGWSAEWRLWSLALQEARQNCWIARLKHPRSGAELSWEVQIGDARLAELPPSKLDYIWQDAFSHKKNPELWTPEWFQKLRAASRPDVCLVSYSVARLIRDHMTEAGWIALRFKPSATPAGSQIPGKRNWLIARLPETFSTI